MNKEQAFRIIRNNLDKSSTANWRSVEKAIDYLELEYFVDKEFDNTYCERLERFQSQMEAVFNDFHGAL